MSEAADAAAALDQVRAICLALPETAERLSHGSPGFHIEGRGRVCTIRRG